MNMELIELLGKNYYSYVAEEKSKYQEANPEAIAETASDKDDFILDYEFSLEKNVHSVYHISEDKTKNYLTEALEVHFIDLDKLRKGMGMEGLDQSLLKWLRFLAAKRAVNSCRLKPGSSCMRPANNLLRKLG